MCKAEFAKSIDKMIFPGIQGGPLVQVIAAKAVAFKEALLPRFKEYQRQVLSNAKRLASALTSKGFTVISGGTDNHLMLVDLTNLNVTGKEAEEALDKTGVTVNKNGIPYDQKPATITSGIRLGTPCVTTRGMGETEMEEIADIISSVIRNIDNSSLLETAGLRVQALCEKFSVYQP